MGLDTSTTEQTRRVPPQPRPQLDLPRRRRSDIGPVATTIVIAGVAAIGVALALGLVIPRIVEAHLLDATALSIKAVVDDIADTLPPGDDILDTDLAELETSVQHDLLGRDLVRVKIWDATGMIIYSNEPRLIGSRYELSDDLIAAFSGDIIHEEPDLSRPENVYERGLGQLREYYVPVDSGEQGIDAVFEVYERAETLEATTQDIAAAVWIALGVGAAILLLAFGVAATANARAVHRRQARSERLLRQLLEAQDAERTRVVGALHDDVGQPLYRIMFGLQASIDKAEAGSDLESELQTIDDLVRTVDATLRSQLTNLRDEPGIEIDLVTAITELTEIVEAETGLDIDLQIDVATVLPLEHRAMLFRAVREALENIRRHAVASHVGVSMVEGADDTMIEVVDNGVGLTSPSGLGLTTLTDRLESIGGGVLVEEARGGGVRFVAWVPNEAVIDA